MNNKFWKISPKKLLYYGAWIIFSIVYILFQQSEFIHYHHASLIYKYVSYLVIAMLCLCILIDSRFKYRELFIYCALTVLFAIIYWNRSNRTFIVYMLFVLAFKSIRSDFNNLVKIDLKVKMMLIIFVVLMCYVGVINDYSGVWWNGVVRHAYGFYHPNTLGILVFAILTEWLYLRYKKAMFVEWIFILTIVYLMYRLAASRTALYTFSFIFCLFIIAQKWPNFFKIKINKILFILAIPIAGLISWGGLYLYLKGNAIAQVINTLTTQRLRYAANFYKDYGVSIFGKDVVFVSSRAAQLQGISSEILDMVYIRGPILFGIVFSAVFFFGYMMLIRKCLSDDKKNNNDLRLNFGLLVFITYYVILGLGENYLLNPIYCLPMVLIPNAFAKYSR